MSQRADEIRGAVEPVVVALGLSLYDLVVDGGAVPTVTVLVSRSGGTDLDSVTEASRAISPLLDRLDVSRGRYTLEVSSPGLERPLRHHAQFLGARGERVTLKLRGADGAVERVSGTLVDVTDTCVTIDSDGGVHEAREVELARIDSARTVFEWGSAAAPVTRATRQKPTRKKKEAARR